MKTIVIGTLSLIVTVGLAYGSAAEGKGLYGTKCAACHGANGEGKAAIGKAFGVTMAPLGSKEVQSMSDADIKKVILSGKGKMKPVAGVTEKQADDIAAFVKTLKE
ncbi:MAG: cytochrome c [Acidobacteriia bacterium]|nr:cytochrome c [Terriglobia bacterium]